MNNFEFFLEQFMHKLMSLNQIHILEQITSNLNFKVTFNCWLVLHCQVVSMQMRIVYDLEFGWIQSFDFLFQKLVNCHLERFYLFGLLGLSAASNLLYLSLIAFTFL